MIIITITIIIIIIIIIIRTKATMIYRCVTYSIILWSFHYWFSFDWSLICSKNLFFLKIDNIVLFIFSRYLFFILYDNKKTESKPIC